MKPFVTLASLIVLIASASAGGDDDYSKYGGIKYGPGISLGGGGLGGLGGGSLGGGVVGIGGGGIGGIGGIGIGGGIGGIGGGLIGGFGPGSVSGTINPFGGVRTRASGLFGTSPAVRGAAQGAATASALGVLSGRPSRVSGVSVGTGGGRAIVSGSATPIGGYGGIVPYGGSYGYSLPSYGYSLPSYGVSLGGYGGYGGYGYGYPDLATFQGSTYGNLATGSINSAYGSIPYGGALGIGYGGIGYGYGGLGLGGGYGGLGGGYGIGGGYGGLLGGYGLGGSSFTGVSQSLYGGRAVMSGQAFGAGVPGVTVGFGGVGVGSPYGVLPLGGIGGGVVGPIGGGGGVVGPIGGGGGVVGPIGGGGIIGPIGGGGIIRKKKY